MGVDICLCLGASVDASDGKWMNVELRDAVAASDESEKLALCGLQGGVWHHIEQADMQLSNVLLVCPFECQDLFPFSFESGEGW